MVTVFLEPSKGFLPLLEAIRISLNLIDGDVEVLLPKRSHDE